jgi:Flp pilus assembly protein TadD
MIPSRMESTIRLCARSVARQLGSITEPASTVSCAKDLRPKVRCRVRRSKASCLKRTCPIRSGASELAERAPEDRTSLTELAWVYVCLGRNDDALRIAREATEALPIEKDALVGGFFLTGLAQIEAHTGQAEEAVKILRLLLTISAGEYVSLVRLKIDPVWDPIRNYPGFQKLLSEPEPETAYK